MSKVSRQRLWQIKKMAEGKCCGCGKPRGNSTSVQYCDSCRIKYNKIQRNYRVKNKTIDSDEQKS